MAEGVKIHWLRTIRAIDGTHLDGRGHGARREGSAAADRASSRRSRRTALVMALGQDSRQRLPAQGRGRRVPSRTARWSSTANMMTGHPGAVRRRRHGAVGAHRHGRGRPRQEGGAPHRRLAARRELRQAAPSTTLATFEKLHVWYYTDAAQRQQQALEIGERLASFDEVVAGLERGRGALRGAPLPVLRQLLRVRRLLRRLPGARDRSSSAPASATATTTTCAPAARSASSSARATPSR